MRRKTKVAAGGFVLAIVLVFFFAPMLYWTSARPPIPPAYFNTPGLALPVYRSLGCAILGYGVLYSPGSVTVGGLQYPAFGFSLGCNTPYPVYVWR
jgi:hypothetical protein